MLTLLFAQFVVSTHYLITNSLLIFTIATWQVAHSEFIRHCLLKTFSCIPIQSGDNSLWVCHYKWYFSHYAQSIVPLLFITILISAALINHKTKRLTAGYILSEVHDFHFFPVVKFCHYCLSFLKLLTHRWHVKPKEHHYCTVHRVSETRSCSKSNESRSLPWEMKEIPASSRGNRGTFRPLITKKILHNNTDWSYMKGSKCAFFL